MQRNIRLVLGTIIYLIILFVLMVFLRIQFAGFTGVIGLFILGFGSHALADYILHRMKKKFKGKNNISV